MLKQPCRRAFFLVFALSGAASLAGCVAPIIAGTAVGGYTLATQERSPQQLARDAAIGAVVHKAWLDYNTDVARDLTATVYDGRVLITGIVPRQEWRREAVERARRVNGVGEVYDEIQVGPDTGFVQDAKDDVISNRLRASLLADGAVRSSNYSTHTLNGIVYIIGYARDAAERERVIGYARNLPDVRRVVTFIRVGNAGPAAAPPPPPPRGGPPEALPEAPPEMAPTPRGSIEVTPLQ